MLISSKAALAAALLCVFVGAHAVDYKDEYEKKIKAAQDVGVLGDDLAGDEVNFFTGQVSFKATDVRLQGNYFELSVGRSYDIKWDDYYAQTRGATVDPADDVWTPILHSFGMWDLEVPHIETIMTQDGGWVVDTGTPTNRCSVVGQTKSSGQPADGAPPAVLGTRAMVQGPTRYWSGYQIHADGIEQSMLAATLPNTNRPSTGGPYHWTTNKDWWISCLPNTANNAGGEGFLAIAPDGKKYWFNWLSKRNTNDEEESFTDPGGDKTWVKTTHVYRADYWMLPTRIEDRFGNWVKYSWSNDAWAQLQSITTGKVGSTIAEQTITVTYNAQHFVQSITDGTRTWTYTYGADNQLDKVILPDGTFWQYAFGTYNLEAPKPYCDGDPTTQEWYWICFGGGAVFSDPAQASVWHPSGARVDFVFDNHFQFSTTKPSSYPLSLVSKTINGAGMAPRKWQIYYPDKETIKAACQAGACPAYALRDFVAPDSHITRQVFSYDGQLQGQFEGSLTANGGGSPAITNSARWGTAYPATPAAATGAAPYFYKEIDNRYVASGQAVGYIERVGVNPLSGDIEAETFQSERRLPIKTLNLYQQGVTFARVTNTYDSFARPLSVTRSSTGNAGGNFSRTETYDYSNNTAKWVVGQVKSLTDGATSKVMSQTIYDASTALPLQTFAFGILQQTITYNPDGTVATVKDGRNNVISVSNWKAGIPQRIDYPTGYNEQAVVNGIGNIASTTDELGSTTGYGYDAMGRLSSISYPTGDTVAWNPLNRGLVQTAATEYGITGTHWKQTVNTGAGKTTTWYDVQFRPILILTEDTNSVGSRSFVVKRYDLGGRESFVSYPVASTSGVNDAALTGTTTSYDALGRPFQVSQASELGALLTSTEYLSGFTTRVTNPRGYQSTTKYQVFDEPKTDAPVSVINAVGKPEQQATTIIRDGFGKPLSITRSGG